MRKSKRIRLTVVRMPAPMQWKPVARQILRLLTTWPAARNQTIWTTSPAAKRYILLFPLLILRPSHSPGLHDRACTRAVRVGGSQSAQAPEISAVPALSLWVCCGLFAFFLFPFHCFSFTIYCFSLCPRVPASPCLCIFVFLYFCIFLFFPFPFLIGFAYISWQGSESCQPYPCMQMRATRLDTDSESNYSAPSVLPPTLSATANQYGSPTN